VVLVYDTAVSGVAALTALQVSRNRLARLPPPLALPHAWRHVHASPSPNSAESGPRDHSAGCARAANNRHPRSPSHGRCGKRHAAVRGVPSRRHGGDGANSGATAGEWGRGGGRSGHDCCTCGDDVGPTVMVIALPSACAVWQGPVVRPELQRLPSGHGSADRRGGSTPQCSLVSAAITHITQRRGRTWQRQHGGVSSISARTGTRAITGTRNGAPAGSGEWRCCGGRTSLLARTRGTHVRRVRGHGRPQGQCRRLP